MGLQKKSEKKEQNKITNFHFTNVLLH